MRAAQKRVELQIDVSDRQAYNTAALTGGAMGGKLPPFEKVFGKRAAQLSYAGFWVIRPDQAARFSATLVATPSVNVTPSMSKGNWFAPFRRRHVLAAA